LAYDKEKMIADVRLMLAGICEDQLPSEVIISVADCYDSNPLYTDDYNMVWFKTTIYCIDWLIRKAILSGGGSSEGTKRTEKVGNTTLTIENNSSTGETPIDNLEKLKEMLLKDPTCFGIPTSSALSLITIGGVSVAEYEALKSDPDAKGMWDELDPLQAAQSTYAGLRRI
jgi:hypothetical protein